MKKIIKKIICSLSDGYIKFYIENNKASAIINYDYQFLKADEKAQKRIARNFAYQLGVDLIIQHHKLGKDELIKIEVLSAKQ